MSIHKALTAAQQLQAARAQWQRQGGTVWDALVVDQPDEAATFWRQELARMDVAVCSHDPSLKPRAANMPVSQGLWLDLADERDAPRWDAPCWLVLADPWDEHAIERATSRDGQVPTLATCSGADLARWASQLVPPLASSRPQQTEATPARPAPTGATATPAEGSVIEFVDQALAQAVALGASDIHFECDRHGVAVKLRVDGVLRPLSRMASVQRAQEVVSRIKVLAQLDITEQRIPQDGRFRQLLSGGASMDLRVSIMPSVHGEDAVLRLLDRAQLRQRDASASLDALEFDADSVARVRDLAQLPHGMLLVTGPTGSGKTTTVYGILSELNSGEEKIVTIEDPVEYELPGVLQIPVNERKGLTFAKGLRSILRHDPDRILVGEIRDADTAEIAVQSALTGHQVFTTVHANSLFDVTGRFRHFGLDMFGFVAALNGVVVQRLVRALCPACKSERPATPREAQWLETHGQPGIHHVPQARGCEACANTGYRRRFVLAEVHLIDDHLRDLITSQQAISALRAHVVSSGVRSLAQVAAQAVIQHRTTLEEVRRVVGFV